MHTPAFPFKGIQDSESQDPQGSQRKMCSGIHIRSVVFSRLLSCPEAAGHPSSAPLRQGW